MALHDATLLSPLRDNVFVRAFRLACFGLCVAQAVYLLVSLFEGQWIVDASGYGIPADFVSVWAAGRLVLSGQAAIAYDWQLHKQVEDAAVGYVFAGHYGWHYPPPFLAVATVLALLPYAVAFGLWAGLTLLLYVGTIRWIVGKRFGYLLAGAFPAVLSNIIVGQNGFLTASLIGGTLGFMERHPALAGCCLGLLTYKPHFGILFPIVLAAGGRWTVIAVAAVVGAAVALASWIFFGMASWEAFFHWLPIASHAFLSEGHADWAKLQSVYGLTRVVGGNDGLASALQVVVALLVAATLCLAWRSQRPFDLKAAALAVSTLLVTPYVYLYDMVVLAIAVAFFIRHVTVRGLRRNEYLALAAMAALIVSFPFVKLPIGIVATGIVAIMIACRLIEPAIGRSQAEILAA
jgi:arabinofuranan 3-O-arabinosyltransferase